MIRAALCTWLLGLVSLIGAAQVEDDSEDET